MKKSKLSSRYKLASLKLTAIRKYLLDYCKNHAKQLGCIPSKFSILSLDAKQELITIPHQDYHLFLKASDMKKLQKIQRKNAVCDV